MPLDRVLDAMLLGTDVGANKVSEIRYQDEGLRGINVNFEGYFHPNFEGALVTVILEKYKLLHYVDRGGGVAFVFRKPYVSSIELFYRDSYISVGAESEAVSQLSRLLIFDQNAFKLLPKRFLKEVQFSDIPEYEGPEIDEIMKVADFLFVFRIDERSYAYAIARDKEGWVSAGGEWKSLPSGTSHADFMKFMPYYLSQFLSRKERYE